MLGWMSPRMIELYSHSSTRDKQQAVTQAGSQVREILQKLENEAKTNLRYFPPVQVN
jgi:hypothetical protein